LSEKGGVRSWVGQSKPDAYATIGIGGDERTTVVAKNSVQHTWEEWYEFPLEEIDGHIVEVNMYDRDKMSKDEFLGYAAIDIKTFSQVKHIFNRGASKQAQGTVPARARTVPSLAVSQPIQTRHGSARPS
jgi:Ca2+-dependent lipid-binding protein